MDKNKMILSFALCIVLLLGLFLHEVATPVRAESSKEIVSEGGIESKENSNAALMNNFAEDRVLVVLSNEASLAHDSYDVTDFAEVDCKKITDLTQCTGQMVKDAVAYSSNELSLDEVSRYSESGNIVNLDVSNYNQVLCIELEEKGKENVLKAIKALEKRQEVIYAGPDYVVSACVEIPDDEFYVEQEENLLIQLPLAWGITTGSSSITVGVLDTGIDGTHPDLKGRINNNLCADFTSGRYVSVSTPTDPHGHGTHVAGIIGAQANNKIGISGVCWSVRLASLRVLDSNGSGYSSYVASAIDFANSRGIKILNLSASWNTSNIGEIAYYDKALSSIISNYFGLFICSAGNDGVNIDSMGIYPACHVLPNLITVGASTYDDRKESYSNFGKTTVDIFAPGGKILSCYPTQLCKASSHNTSTHRASGYHELSGTSMATPYVTGVAALLYAKYPSASPSEIKQKMLSGVEVVVDSNNRDVFGSLCVSGGRLDAYRALHSHSFTGYEDYGSEEKHIRLCSCGGIVEDHTWTLNMVNPSAGLSPKSIPEYECTKCGAISLTPPPNYATT